MGESSTTAFTGPDLCALEAHTVAGLLRSGDVTPADLLDACFARIDRVENRINAMPTLCRERAYAAARALENGPREPGFVIAGLPVAIKDLNAVAGVRTTFGTVAFRDHVPDESDPLVQRMEDRGALVVGKTNTPELGAGGVTFNDVFGRTRNPWNTERNAGGSSGGAAASLAAGEVWLSHGSDHGGSLRTPAAFCGIVGMRPSPGVAGGGSAPDGFQRGGVSGPMARSVRDCALFLDAMAGFDSKGPVSWPAPAAPYEHAVLTVEHGYRIAYAPDLGGFVPVADDMRRYVDDALKTIEAAGNHVELACPDLPDLDHTYRTLRAMMWAAGPGQAPDAVQQHYKPDLVRNIEQGRALTTSDIFNANIARFALFENVVNFLDDFDVLAFPVTPMMPGPVTDDWPKRLGDVEYADYIEWLRFAYLSTTTGLPSISVPVGTSDDGLPVGLQLLGKHRGESALLAVAGAVEQACGGPFGPIDPVTP